jgi:midasin
VFSVPIREALNKIALCISTRVPILLTSPPASGKRSLINYVANRLFPKPDARIVILHLGDTSLDPRSILGSYISSPTNPGQFEWQDGVLVRAMKEGKWLLLKDIDKASVEMHGALIPLIEGCSPTSTLGHRVTIDIPSRGQITASPSFALFATRSMQSRQDANYPPPTFIGSHRFAEICLDAPGQLEQIEILKSKFSRFPEELVVLIRDLWQEVKGKLVRGSAPPLDFRHLERFCCRVDRLYSGATLVQNGGKPSTLTSFFPGTVLREELIMEARDVFLAGTGALRLSDPTLTGVLEILGQRLGFTSENLQFLLSNRDVACDLEKDVNGEIIALRIGRHRLASLKVDQGLTSPFSRPFVLHRPARDLLSRLASGIQQNEPLLLVGETGTGKTSLVSFISKTLRQPLLTFNMSMQTESSDLLGGFRPLDARRAATELLNNFMGIFEQSFSRKKNPRFEHSLREAIYEAKWKRAVALWRQAVKMAEEKFSSVQR